MGSAAVCMYLQLTKTLFLLLCCPVFQTALFQCAGLRFQSQGCTSGLFPGWPQTLTRFLLDVWSCSESLQQLRLVVPQHLGEPWGTKQWTPTCALVAKHQTTSFLLGGPQGGSKHSSRAMLAQEMDPMQSVALTPFPFWCLPCRVLLENSISCTPKVGCAMLPLPELKRPIICCLLLLESPVHGIKHRLIWQSLEDTIVKMGKEPPLFFYGFLLSSYTVQVPQAINDFIGHLSWTFAEGEIWVISWPQGVVSFLIVRFRVYWALIFQVLWKQPAHCYHCALLFRVCGWITSW